MQHARFGRRRPQFSGRPPARRNNFKKSSIHPDKYINRGVERVVEEVLPEIKHSFADFGFDQALETNITRHGYKTPTPIQDQAIPHIMDGKDVVGLANTGTGKTAAFLLPLINRLLQDADQGVMVIVPTRELAVQIVDELREFIRGLQLSMALCIGGANIRMQTETLRKNPHFVIGTPGRIKDLINRGAIDTKMFTNIVLDEVDRMLDIGFLPDIRYIIGKLPQERHSYFFSATMTPEVSGVMRSFVHNPVQVSVVTKRTSTHIYQDVVRVAAGENKIDKLVELLGQKDFDKVIVFGRTKHGINKLEQVLTKRGLKASAIHGNKSQNARQRALDLFKKGRAQVLLATDIAARGIDVSGVTHVINYDEPGSYEDYVHRIGRTGRAGRGGVALTFLN